MFVDAKLCRYSSFKLNRKLYWHSFLGCVVSFIFQFPIRGRHLKKRLGEIMDFLHGTAKEWLKERKEAIARGDYVPEDILTHMIKLQGRYLTSTFFFVSVIWTLWWFPNIFTCFMMLFNHKAYKSELFYISWCVHITNKSLTFPFCFPNERPMDPCSIPNWG